MLTSWPELAASESELCRIEVAFLLGDKEWPPRPSTTFDLLLAFKASAKSIFAFMAALYIDGVQDISSSSFYYSMPSIAG